MSMSAHKKISAPSSKFEIRVECPVPVHHACSCPLGTKNLPVRYILYSSVRNLHDDLKLREKSTTTLLKIFGQINNSKKVTLS